MTGRHASPEAVCVHLELENLKARAEALAEMHKPYVWGRLDPEIREWWHGEAAVILQEVRDA